MKQRRVLSLFTISILAVVLAACDLEISVNTENPAPSAVPAAPGSSNSSQSAAAPTQSQATVYAGATNSADAPFLMIHPSGESVGLARDSGALYGTATVWTAPNGQSFVIYSRPNGLPDSAVVGNAVLLYRNFSGDTVYVTIVYPDGTRVIAPAKLDRDLLNRIGAYAGPSRILIAFPAGVPEQQAITPYIRQVYTSMAYVGCAGAALEAGGYTATGLVPIAMATLAAECHGPFLDAARAVGRVLNLDVRNLDQLNSLLDSDTALRLKCAGLLGPGPGALTDCVQRIVIQQAQQIDAARATINNNMSANPAPAPPAAPTKKPKYP